MNNKKRQVSSSKLWGTDYYFERPNS